MRYIFTLFVILLYASSASAQNTMTGIVKDEQSMIPIPGVTVSVKGKPTSVQTNAAGQYSISAAASDTLTFSFIGYQSQNLAVGNQAQLDVFLVSEDNTLEEVVVIGYGTARKRDL